jgi:hypothetical protein
MVFAVSVRCLLPSNGMAADAAKPANDAAVMVSAVRGFALTTHRPGGGDHGFGEHRPRHGSLPMTALRKE